MVRFGTFGFDILWKKKILEKIPQGAGRVLDLACGTGIVTFLIAQREPGCRITGVDMTAEYLEIAREKASRLGIANVDFILGRAEDVMLPEPLDCVTSSYLPKYADLDRLARNVHSMLRDGGLFVMHDFTYPPNPVVASAWEFYFKFQQSIGTRLYPRWREVYRDLPELIRTSTWVPDLLDALRRHRYAPVTVEPMTLGGATIVTAVKPRPAR